MPDIILLDIVMPVMNGITTLKKINANKKTCHIPVVVLTNFAVYDAVRVFMNPAKDHFLTKTAESLSNIVKKVNSIL